MISLILLSTLVSSPALAQVRSAPARGLGPTTVAPAVEPGFAPAQDFAPQLDVTVPGQGAAPLAAAGQSLRSAPLAAAPAPGVEQAPALAPVAPPALQVLSGPRAEPREGEAAESAASRQDPAKPEFSALAQEGERLADNSGADAPAELARVFDGPASRLGKLRSQPDTMARFGVDIVFAEDGPYDARVANELMRRVRLRVRGEPGIHAMSVGEPYFHTLSVMAGSAEQAGRIALAAASDARVAQVDLHPDVRAAALSRAQAETGKAVERILGKVRSYLGVERGGGLRGARLGALTRQLRSLEALPLDELKEPAFLAGVAVAVKDLLSEDRGSRDARAAAAAAGALIEKFSPRGPADPRHQQLVNFLATRNVDGWVSVEDGEVSLRLTKAQSRSEHVALAFQALQAARGKFPWMESASLELVSARGARISGRLFETLERAGAKDIVSAELVLKAPAEASFADLAEVAVVDSLAEVRRGPRLVQIDAARRTLRIAGAARQVRRLLEHPALESARPGLWAGGEDDAARLRRLGRDPEALEPLRAVLPKADGSELEALAGKIQRREKLSRGERLVIALVRLAVEASNPSNGGEALDQLGGTLKSVEGKYLGRALADRAFKAYQAGDPDAVYEESRHPKSYSEVLKPPAQRYNKRDVFEGKDVITQLSHVTIVDRETGAMEIQEIDPAYRSRLRNPGAPLVAAILEDPEYFRRLPGNSHLVIYRKPGRDGRGVWDGLSSPDPEAKRVVLERFVRDHMGEIYAANNAIGMLHVNTTGHPRLHVGFVLGRTSEDQAREYLMERYPELAGYELEFRGYRSRKVPAPPKFGPK